MDDNSSKLVLRTMIGLAVVAITVLLYRLGQLALANALCRAPLISDDHTVALTIRSAGACAEYWSNRYQTLIGASVAVAAATTAYITSRQGLARTDAGLAIARRQLAATSVEHLGRRQEILTNVRFALEASQDVVPAPVFDHAEKLLRGLADGTFTVETPQQAASIAKLLHDNGWSLRQNSIENKEAYKALERLYLSNTLSQDCRGMLSARVAWQNSYSGCLGNVGQELQLLSTAMTTQRDQAVPRKELDFWMPLVRKRQEENTICSDIELIDKELLAVAALIDKSIKVSLSPM